MILAYHCIFGAYGFWLPNDPRGSWSDYVRSWEVFHFGPATKTDQRRSHARDEHDQRHRRAAKSALRHPPVQLTGLRARAVGDGFARAAEEGGHVILACSILPEHVHVVVRRRGRPAERIVQHLKSRATKQLNARGLHPLATRTPPGRTPPSPWARYGWNVYLNSVQAVARAIEYVNTNPLKEGKPPQRWSFVVANPWADGMEPCG